jgi:hypothetical protein
MALPPWARNICRNNMTIAELVALASVLISIGANIDRYVHLSAVMNGRFDSVHRKFESVERRLEMIQSDTHNLDVRPTRLAR